MPTYNFNFEDQNCPLQPDPIGPLNYGSDNGASRSTPEDQEDEAVFQHNFSNLSQGGNILDAYVFPIDEDCPLLNLSDLSPKELNDLSDILAAHNPTSSEPDDVDISTSSPQMATPPTPTWVPAQGSSQTSDELPISGPSPADQEEDSQVNEQVALDKEDVGGPSSLPQFLDPLARQPTTHAERNPLLPIQPTRNCKEKSTRKLTEAQLASRKLAREDRKFSDQQLNEDVSTLAANIEGLIQATADKHNVAKEVVQEKLGNLDRLKSSRACGRMQALIHLKGLEVNPDLPTGQKLKAPQLLQLVKQDSNLMKLSGDGLRVAMKEVETARLLRLKGARANNRAAGRDYRATCDKLSEAFDNVFLRTGAIGFGFLVMPTRDDEGDPTFFIAGPDTPEFVRHHLHMEMWDLLNKAELWAADRAKEYILGSRKKVRMNYENYDAAIIQKHGVQLVGLPEGMQQLTKPTSHAIPAHVARDLYTRLQAGTCRWVRMTIDELTAHEAQVDAATAAGNPVGKARAGRSDKGKKRETYAGRPVQRDQGSDDGNGGEASEDDEEESSRKRRKTAHRAPQPTAKPRKSKSKRNNGPSKKISKQLPPYPRSKSTIGDETDEEAGAS
ncbi:hypothetical protein PQX77_004419 [Marasmius sp. AFHP31]|nr:hypothetical protein PQX77_004419 [Marasmius sp. AFHP31]